MRALVGVVVHAVAIGITPHVGTKVPSEGCCTGNQRGRGIAVFVALAIFTLELDNAIVAALHFFIAIIERVLEGTDCHFKSHCEVDVVGQMEAQTRRHDHRIFTGFKLVHALGLQAGFAGVFQEHIHPGLREPVHASAIHEHLGFVQVQRVHILGKQVEAELLGVAELGEVSSTHQTKTEGPVVCSVRLSIAIAVQVPGMAGAHTGLSFTRRNVHVQHGGKAVPFIGVKRESDLGPDIQVTTARTPHVVTTRRAIRVSVFVVNRQAHTHVHPVGQTRIHEEVTGLAIVPPIEIIGLVVLSVLTPTSKSPAVESDVTTGTHGKVPLAKSLGISLVETVRAALHAYLGKADSSGQ